MLLLPSVPLLYILSALTKIFKKHDKQMRDNLSATEYFDTRAKDKYYFLRQLYHNEGRLSLVASLKREVRREASLTTMWPTQEGECTIAYSQLLQNGTNKLGNAMIESATATPLNTLLLVQYNRF